MIPQRSLEALEVLISGVGGMGEKGLCSPVPPDPLTKMCALLSTWDCQLHQE